MNVNNVRKMRIFKPSATSEKQLKHRAWKILHFPFAEYLFREFYPFRYFDEGAFIRDK